VNRPEFSVRVTTQRSSVCAIGYVMLFLTLVILASQTVVLAIHQWRPNWSLIPSAVISSAGLVWVALAFLLIFTLRVQTPPCTASYRRKGATHKPTAAQVGELLADNIVFNSPILVRPIEGREACAAIFAQSSATRGSGTYIAESKLDEHTTFLRWVGTMDGHKFESLEVIVDNGRGWLWSAQLPSGRIRL